MKTLLLLRHAKSSWDDPTLADHDRPLSGRGRRDAPRMGELLRDEDLVPEVILSSTAKRARKTAEAVAEASHFDGEIRLVGDLYGADVDTLIELLRTVADESDRVLMIGHNPELTELVEALTRRIELLPTGALAAITLPIQRWAELAADTAGTLAAVWRPRELQL
jgi:phosphohistidine phosphatase